MTFTALSMLFCSSIASNFLLIRARPPTYAINVYIQQKRMEYETVNQTDFQTKGNIKINGPKSKKDCFEIGAI